MINMSKIILLFIVHLLIIPCFAEPIEQEAGNLNQDLVQDYLDAAIPGDQLPKFIAAGEQAVAGGEQAVAGGEQAVAGGEQAVGGGAQKRKPKLKIGYYNNTCPWAEKVVATEVNNLFKTNPPVIANFIRLLFHDCFVNGCDASLLLDTAATGDDVEKSSRVNGELLHGSEFIDDIKMKLEESCPGIVSCSDIMAFAAMESMALGGVPRRPFLGGRRDGTVSLASNIDILRNLPLPEWTPDQIIELFGKKGFTIEEMVVLMGGHSLGVAHCNVFSDRLYTYTAGAAAGADPLLGPQVVNELTKVCKPPGTPEARANPVVSFDETPLVIDNLFFKNMMEQKKALLASDQHLSSDPRTVPIVQRIAQDNAWFQNMFADMMVKLSSLDVIVGKRRGEIRRTCRSTN